MENGTNCFIFGDSGFPALWIMMELYWWHHPITMSKSIYIKTTATIQRLMFNLLILEPASPVLFSYSYWKFLSGLFISKLLCFIPSGSSDFQTFASIFVFVHPMQYIQQLTDAFISHFNIRQSILFSTPCYFIHIGRHKSGFSICLGNWVIIQSFAYQVPHREYPSGAVHFVFNITGPLLFKN